MLHGDKAASSTPLRTPALKLWYMGYVAERALGKKSRTTQYQQKTDFLQKSGAGNLCPMGNCLFNSWPGSLWRGPTAVLASASGEAQQPPTLPCFPTCQQMSFFRAHHAQRLICAQTHGTGICSWVLERFWGWEELNLSISALWPQTGGMFPLTSLPSGQDLSRLIFKCILG